MSQEAALLRDRRREPCVCAALSAAVIATLAGCGGRSGGVFSLTVTTTSDHTGGPCIIKGANWTDPWGASTADNPRFDLQACP